MIAPVPDGTQRCDVELAHECEGAYGDSWQCELPRGHGNWHSARVAASDSIDVGFASSASELRHEPTTGRVRYQPTAVALRWESP